MTGGVQGFVPARLAQAREARNLSYVALSEVVGVTSSAISQYEKGVTSPRPDVVDRLSKALNIPAGFLYKGGIKSITGNLYYRSNSASVKPARRRARRRLEWFKEIADYLENYIDFPNVNLPKFDYLPNDPLSITNEMIEDVAISLREYWQLGDGPIPNMTRLVESNGILVARGKLDSEHLDAFSEFDQHGRPWMFLSSDKNVMVRTRFDVGHELFHLIAHRDVSQADRNKTEVYAALEKQAHRFSSAFQLPEKAFSGDIWDVSIDAFRAMKPRWKVSIGSMVFRAVQLKLIDEASAKRLRISISRRGWRKGEPLDDLPVETPTTIARSINLLISERIKTPDQIKTELCLPESDIVELAGLDADTLSPDQKVGVPTLKKPNNVVNFSR